MKTEKEKTFTREAMECAMHIHIKGDSVDRFLDNSNVIYEKMTYLNSIGYDDVTIYTALRLAKYYTPAKRILDTFLSDFQKIAKKLN